MDAAGLTWAVGAMLSLIVAGGFGLFGYIWATNNANREAIAKLSETTGKSLNEIKDLNTECLGELKGEVAKLSERMAVQETMMEPLCEITKAAVPKILKLHSSPDVLEDAFNGEPDEEKLLLAESRVEQELDSDPPIDRMLPLALAKWQLRIRRRDLERMRRKHDVPQRLEPSDRPDSGGLHPD